MYNLKLQKCQRKACQALNTAKDQERAFTPSVLLRKGQVSHRYQPAWPHEIAVRTGTTSFEVDKAAQLGNGDLKASNRVSDSPCSDFLSPTWRPRPSCTTVTYVQRSIPDMLTWLSV